MSTRRLTISVPQPCHEDWQAMAPAFQGRFCQNCQKTVVDFTAMSDAEVVHWLTKQKGSTCGRFSEKQLERELAAISASRNQWTWKAVALGLSAWLSAKTVEAKDLALSPATEQQKQTVPTEQAANPTIDQAPDSLLVVKGTVVDAQTKEPVSGASMILKGTTLGVATDAKGIFNIDIPVYLKADSVIISFSYIGYKTENVRLSKFSNTDPIILLQPAERREFTSGIVVVAESSWYSPRGLYYRLKSLFR